MNRPDPMPSGSLARFLAAAAAERDGASAAVNAGDSATADLADAALFELLAELPRPLPRRGFAERAALAAMAADLAGMAAAAPRASRAARLWRQWALAACLAAADVGVALQPLSAGAVRLMTLAITELGSGLADLFSFWQRLVSVQRALVAVVASPGMLAVAGLCLLISALALRFLHDLVERERSWTHAHPSR